MEAVFEKVKKIAEKEGVDFELSIGQTESFSASFQGKRLHKYKVDNAQGAGVRVLKGKGTGFTRTENLSEESIKTSFYEALHAAIESDKFAKANKLTGEIYYTDKKVEVPGLSQEFSLTIEEKLNLARALEEEALKVDPRITNVPYSGYSENRSKTFLFNSKGLKRDSESSVVTAYSYSLAKEGDDSKSGYEAQFSRTNGSISALEIAKVGAEKALKLLGAKSITSGNYAVVLDQDVFSDLISFLISHLSADKIDEKTSLFVGKKGAKVVSEKINIWDDPFEVSLMGARAYDAEGVPSQRTNLIDSGFVTNFLTNSFLASKLNLPLTGHAVRSGSQLGVAPSNIIVQTGSVELETLLNYSNKVLHITSVDALHSGFKGTTLDFSLPASGFLYENGKVSQPVHQVVLSGNLLEILKSDLELSNRPSSPAGNVRTPDIFIPKLSVAGA